MVTPTQEILTIDLLVLFIGTKNKCRWSLVLLGQTSHHDGQTMKVADVPKIDSKKVVTYMGALSTERVPK